MASTMNRRAFLRGAVISGGLLAAQPSLLLPRALARTRIARWSDPQTWGGSVPGENDVAVVSKPILLDVNAAVAGVKVRRGGRLIFHPRRSVALFSSGNVEVRGRLVMKPAAHRRKHRIVFVGIDESRFKGGGMKVLNSDVGLWVMGRGMLDLAGTPKKAWLRAAGTVPAGTRTIKLKGDPDGWRVGDRVVITPTLPPTDPNFATAFDEVGIIAIDGRTITLSTPTSFDHPKVEVAPGRVFTAEVLNLSRNVRIQGKSGRRAHIFINSTREQNIKHTTVRFLGPRQDVPGEDFTKKVLGRWALHFHHCMHHSRGSVVKGVVARDCGSHAFVPHASHGIKFKDCVAYNNLETPYWWDEPTETDPSRSHDILYQFCVAARIEFDPSFRGGTKLMGFSMAQGDHNAARACVAVGVGGQNSIDGSSGFGWIANKTGLWTHENCVSHNNKNLGTRFWINNPGQHVIDRLTAYHNRAGTFNGAYGNSADYIDCNYYGNSIVGVLAKATSHKKPQRFVNTRVDQAGLSDYCVEFNEHVNDPPRPILIRDCSFTGHKKAALGFTNDTKIPDFVDLVGCDFGGNEFWLGNDVAPESRIRVQDDQHGAIQLARWDQVLEGEFRPEWNARVKSISSFA